MQQHNKDKVIDAICQRFIKADGRVTNEAMREETTALIRAVEMAESGVASSTFGAKNGVNLAQVNPLIKRLLELAGECCDELSEPVCIFSAGRVAKKTGIAFYCLEGESKGELVCVRFIHK